MCKKVTIGLAAGVLFCFFAVSASWANSYSSYSIRRHRAMPAWNYHKKWMTPDKAVKKGEHNSNLDLNKDGKVDVRDVVSGTKTVAKIKEAILKGEYNYNLDLNKDGKVDVRDAVLGIKTVAKIKEAILKGEYNYNLDLNKDGKVDVRDAVLGIKTVAKIKEAILNH